MKDEIKNALLALQAAIVAQHSTLNYWSANLSGPNISVSVTMKDGATQSASYPVS